MKVYILRLGTIHADENCITHFATRGTKSNPNKACNWVEVPIFAALIQTPDHWILYDLGCMRDAMEGGWPKVIQENLPLTREKDEYIEEQLALIGITPQDVDIVVVSHLHADHFGGIELFTHCDVYLPKEDWVNALIKNHENNIPGNGGSYNKRCIEAPVKQYYPIEIGDDFQLVPGVDVITLPGHAPNLLGLVVHLEEDGTLIFPSDAIALQKLYGPPARLGGAAFNQVDYMKSVEKVRRLERKYGAKVMISHDPALYAEYRKAPDCYR